MLDSLRCPACSSVETKNVLFTHTGSLVTSDFMVLKNSTLAPRFCQSCGLVYENSGVRAVRHQFYAETFQPKPMMKVFGKDSVVARPERANALLHEMISDLNRQGAILEIGAGKGGFLSQFLKEHQEWNATAIEPSVLFETLKDEVPQVQLHHGGYESFECPKGDMDLIVSLGVIEHVDNPLAFIEWASHALTQDGYLFLEAPNFANHPADLLCPDHLSKLTLDVVERYATHSGLKLVASREIGVPMYIAMQKTAEATPRESSTNRFSDELSIKHSQAVFQMLQAVSDGRQAAAEAGEKFGIFGLGIPGIFAPNYFNFPATDIEAYFDDNSAMWTTKVNGRDVCSPEDIHSRNIKHIALSMSPAYSNSVLRRLETLGVRVYR